MIRTEFLELYCDTCHREQTVVKIENSFLGGYPTHTLFVCGTCFSTDIEDNRGSRCEQCYRPDTVEWEDGTGVCSSCGWTEED